jgi:EmrB/QacA subfamily drug resistance transporter
VTTTAPKSQPATTFVMPTGRALYLVLGALMSAMFLSALDQTIVATALPTISGDLHGADLLSWVITAYLLTSTATAPLYGKIGDLYGRKRIFQIAIVIFLVSSALCAAATSMLQLILFRGLQGAGAGGILTLTFAIVGDIVPLRDRGKFQGYFGLTFLLASVVGPLLGGFAVDQLTWHAVFWINLPLGAVTLAIVARFLHVPTVRTEHRIDWVGAALIMSGISALLIAAQTGGKDLAWTSPGLIGIAVLGVVLLAGFVGWERGREEPLLPMHLFANRAFAVANSIAFLTSITMFGAIAFLPQYMQIVHDVSATESGLRALPTLLGVTIASTTAGRLTTRTGTYRHFPIIGTGTTLVSIGLLASLGPHSSLNALAWAMFVFGAGMGFTMQTLVLASQNSVGGSQIGVATSTVTFFRSMGGSVGASLLGAVLTARFSADVRRASPGLDLPTHGEHNVLSSPTAVRALPAHIHEIVTTSFSTALHTMFLCAIPVAVISFALSWRLPHARLRERGDTQGDDVLVELAEPAI